MDDSNSIKIEETNAASSEVETPESLDATMRQEGSVLLQSLSDARALQDELNAAGDTQSAQELNQAIADSAGEATQMFDLLSSQDSVQVIGGELIVPTSILIGETGSRAAEERGYLSAITSALAREDVTMEEKQANVQEIVNAAKAFGVPIETLRAHLSRPGISVVEAVKADKPNSPEKPLSQPLSQEEIIDMSNTAIRLGKEYFLKDQESVWSMDSSTEDTPKDMMIARSEIGDDLGHRFDAHGITKGSGREQLATLVGMLNNGIDKDRSFYTTDLYRSDESEIAGAVGAAGPYDNGAFIVIGPPRGLEARVGSNGIKENGIHGVIVNREWYGAVDRLQKAFPNVRFIKAEDLKDTLQAWVGEVDKK